MSRQIQNTDKNIGNTVSKGNDLSSLDALHLPKAPERRDPAVSLSGTAYSKELHHKPEKIFVSNLSSNSETTIDIPKNYSGESLHSDGIALQLSSSTNNMSMIKLEFSEPGVYMIGSQGRDANNNTRFFGVGRTSVSVSDQDPFTA
jgi:hypothetical protein